MTFCIMNAFDFVAPVVNEFEIHISGDASFTSGPWGRKVKDLGGSYTECRGYHDGRTVYLPNTAPGRKLLADLVSRFAGYVPLGKKDQVTVVFRRIEGACAYRGEGEANLVVNYLSSVFVTSGRALPPDCVLAQLGARLTKYEAQCRAWWERAGRPAAIAREEEKARYEAERKARAPGAVAAMVREALALGCSVEEVRAAVEAAFASKESS